MDWQPDFSGAAVTTSSFEDDRDPKAEVGASSSCADSSATIPLDQSCGFFSSPRRVPKLVRANFYSSPGISFGSAS